jgi:hypothetical protein
MINVLTDLRILHASSERCLLRGKSRGNICSDNILSRSFEAIVFSYALVHLLITAISASVNSRAGSGAFLGLGAVALALGGGGAAGVGAGVDMVGGKNKR